MNDIIEKVYMPFSKNELKEHFLKDYERQIDYFIVSSDKYKKFLKNNIERKGISISSSRSTCQIEKDEKFWTLTALKKIYDNPSRVEILQQLLTNAFGEKPPLSECMSWEDCLSGEIKLFFEACLPTSSKYNDYLINHFDERQFIPYILNASKRDTNRIFEGPTHVDAIFLNISNGFSWMIEAKVLSDISYSTSFDIIRNQLARNIDVMLCNEMIEKPLSLRDPSKTIFSLLTPKVFRDNPKTRLYGFKMKEYKDDIENIKNDLPHLKNIDNIQNKIGWITFEEIFYLNPESCPWINLTHAST